MATQTRKEAATEFLKLVASGKVREGFQKHVARGFKHHNPFFRGDAASLLEGMAQNAAGNPQKALEVHRALEEGSYVAVFSRVRHKPDDPGAALVHIFRFEGERIAELWDIAQAVPENCVNENGMF